MNIDLSTALGVTIGLLPEVVLTGFGLIVLLLVSWRHRGVADLRLAGWVSLAGLLASLAALAWLWVGQARPMNGPNMIVLDDFRFAASALILVAGIATVLLSHAYLEREGILAPEYFVLVVLATVGMLFLAGADDMMVLFLGLEIMSVAVYVLAGFQRGSAFSAEAALKYFLIGAFASAFLLYGIALTYGVTGTTSLSVAGTVFGRGSLPVMGGLGLAFVLIGFGFKVAAVPFHMWTPDVYDGAPTPITGFMATGVKVAAFAALVRVLIGTFGTAGDTWQPIVAALAVFSMVIGNLVALSQPTIKRMLAYSSIAHAGYLLAALVTGSTLGVTAVLVYLLAYVLTSLAAFGFLALLGREGERDVSLGSIAGLARQRPWLAAGLSACMLSLLGFPGTLGFIGKWMILLSLVGQGHSVIAVIVVLASLVSAGYYLPVIMSVYMRPEPAESVHGGMLVSRPVAGTLTFAILLILVLGVWPTPAIETAMASAGSLYDGIVAGVHHALR
jgi:NADH-quinone oxidoreductase subunit N